MLSKRVKTSERYATTRLIEIVWRDRLRVNKHGILQPQKCNESRVLICFLIKLDGNRFQGQTKSLYPVFDLRLSSLILNPLWRQVLAPKTCSKYLVRATNNNLFF